MKLTYRGNSYESSELIDLNSDSIEQENIKLIYRGQTFYYTPPVKSKQMQTGGETVTIMYRGVPYQRQLPPPQPYQKPRALNWRWQSL